MDNAKRTTREANGLVIEKVVDKRWKGKAEYLVKWQGVQNGRTHTWVSGLAINSDKGRSEVPVRKTATRPSRTHGKVDQRL